MITASQQRKVISVASAYIMIGLHWRNAKLDQEHTRSDVDFLPTYWEDFDREWMSSAEQPANVTNPEYMQLLWRFTEKHPSRLFFSLIFCGVNGLGVGRRAKRELQISAPANKISEKDQ